jgi:hypothetical protein
MAITESERPKSARAVDLIPAPAGVIIGEQQVVAGRVPHRSFEVRHVAGKALDDHVLVDQQQQQLG